MKIDKYSAILGNTVGFHDMDGLTEHRPIASLPLVENIASSTSHCLTWLTLVSVASLVSSKTKNISSVFDHIRSGREWGLSTLLSHYYLGYFITLQLKVQRLMKNTIVKF